MLWVFLCLIALCAFKPSAARIRMIPGCDHAGLAAHEKIMARLGADFDWTSADGAIIYENASRAWETEHRGIIQGQIESLRIKADWSESLYTLDEPFPGLIDEALGILGNQKRLSFGAKGQLFLDLRSEARELAHAIENGSILISPPSHAKHLTSMLREERLWDIARDIPWGHRRRFEQSGAHANLVSLGSLGRDIALDTWFSSALWPRACAPGRTLEALLIGYDISYFWGVRMLMLNKACFGFWPFQKMLLHGPIRDAQGAQILQKLGQWGRPP